MPEVHGLVTDAAGQPLEGVRLRFAETQTGLFEIVFTQAGGRYRTPDLPQGTYSISVSRPGFTRRRRSLILDATGPVNFDTIELDQLGIITGSVVDENGNPVAAVEIVAERTTAANRGSALSDANGQFVIDGLSAGPYRVSAVPPPGFQPPNPQLVDVALNDVAGVDLVLPPLALGSISGQVLDDAGKGLAGVEVQAISNGQVVTQINSDANGQYHLRDLAAGAYTVQTTAPEGFQPLDSIADVAVLDGQDTGGVDFQFTVVLCGRVHGADGRGLQRPVTATDDRTRRTGPILSRADGHYFFTHLPSGVYTVEVDSAAGEPSFPPAHNIRVEPGGQVKGIDFSLRAIGDLLSRLEDRRFGVEPPISENEAHNASSLFSIINILLAGLSGQSVGPRELRDVLGVLHLYYGLQDGSLKRKLSVLDATQTWNRLEPLLKQLAAELQRLQSDVDFLIREGERQFSLGDDARRSGNLRFPDLFARLVEVGSDPLLNIDIAAAENVPQFDRSEIAKADARLKDLKQTILHVVRSLGKSGTAATKRLNEDWAGFESRALEVLQILARDRVTSNRIEKNSWTILSELLDKPIDTEVFPHVALARHGGRLLRYSLEIYAEDKAELDSFAPEHLRNLFQRGNDPARYWTSRIREQAAIVKQYPLRGWLSQRDMQLV